MEGSPLGAGGLRGLRRHPCYGLATFAVSLGTGKQCSMGVALFEGEEGFVVCPLRDLFQEAKVRQKQMQISTFKLLAGCFFAAKFSRPTLLQPFGIPFRLTG